MKNVYLIAFVFGFLFLSSFQSSAQNQSDSIYIKKQLGTIFLQNGKALTPSQLMEVTKNNPEAYKEMKIAKSNSSASMVFAAIGGGLMGWPVGTMLGGGDPNWLLALAGVGVLVAVSIPFSVSYTKHATKGMEIYNSGVIQAPPKEVSMHFGFTGNGLGLSVNF